jgi:hypothetical protein
MHKKLTIVVPFEEKRETGVGGDRERVVREGRGDFWLFPE